ncbi:hypothetical protein SKAU_G00334340 [Synaphobranchus kaupii]|uniref:Uncharacterized protein n=1 Tax=Synaphobranchus kaupii TaxID=118154 RepID=A0A9Q1IGM1_SYNKA|nr:hypothetical protein SKAU_G00334340 [Synaphobranchus kaupii]
MLRPRRRCRFPPLFVSRRNSCVGARTCACAASSLAERESARGDPPPGLVPLDADVRRSDWNGFIQAPAGRDGAGRTRDRRCDLLHAGGHGSSSLGTSRNTRGGG